MDIEDPQLRMRGLVALKDYDSETAVPLLIAQRQDTAFLMRSFVAMGLGRKRNEAAYTTLLEMLNRETDHNVKAEIANSLGLYGARAIETLVTLFHEDDSWLVRRSILAIMPDLETSKKLLEISLEALKDKDQTIAHLGIVTLGRLANTPQQPIALATLLPLIKSEDWQCRRQLAYALRSFDTQAAKEALSQLRRDSHHQVVAATLEGLLPG
jgi:HEAT repeat protein